ncbi:hypothetical protein HPP92_003781 [Vanilla planifolia]|uniref:adenylate kinase n=1 Tax=Vanilla planifolia TaxID=51239 RepID=A0A835VJA2_VANPL|nr:hypothetical protein HPP92_003781 [Vanilla planifolia]
MALYPTVVVTAGGNSTASLPHRKTSILYPLSCSSSSTSLSYACLPAYRVCQSLLIDSRDHRNRIPKRRGVTVNCVAGEPLKVMISGAPASGKGTQCRMIAEKYGVVHISTGDILRAEVASGSEIGKKAKEYMDNGMLVPDEIVTDMVMTRLSLPDVKERGWLLDGYPRSFSQAQSLQRAKIKPNICILLDVPDEVLIDRCVGRRMDPVTGQIYHLKNHPPVTNEISARLITSPNDTPEKAEARLAIYKNNAAAILPTYVDLLRKVDGNRPKEVVFEEIDSLLQQIQVHVVKSKNDRNFEIYPVVLAGSSSGIASSYKDRWRGIPTRLNNIPHSKEIRQYFYDDVLQSTRKAVEEKRTRLKVEINIPELNPEMYLTLALSFADDGKRVKVCVQGSMGEGALAGMPLQLAGSRRILEFMDWGEYGAKDTFIRIGSIGFAWFKWHNASNGKDKRLEYASSFEDTTSSDYFTMQAHNIQLWVQ